VVATESGFGAAPDELLHLFEEAGAVGLVLVRHELSRRRLALSIRFRLRLASVQTRQRFSPTLYVVGLN
jgi:hypothetical protein